ncbi:MAG: hypothetical protein A2396_02950 [Candidatus Levybacteria bacterium RIFOXYB1_FULL_40_17]|nr:MAG: hypothetical protein A2396_02950 [Candidatus Levybacteria bacterium RIFOXYB1_FULL_40_17]
MRSSPFDKSYYTSGSYDDYLTRFRQEGWENARALLARINPLPQWRFLDVGAGMGGLTLALRRMGFTAFGTEASAYCLSHSLAKAWLKYAKLPDLPYPPHSFEVVTCIDVLCYLPQPKAEATVDQLTKLARDYLYIESIYPGSPNSSQTSNPDPLRLDQDLLYPDQLIERLGFRQFAFVGPVFASEDEHDFNGLFQKSLG